MASISRKAYAEMYGPTTGHRVRLADTELFIQVEEDRTIYGDEVKFGGGKVIRDGMGQSQRLSSEVVDVVITNALILDHWGIIKADIGIKNGRISGIGRCWLCFLLHLLFVGRGGRLRGGSSRGSRLFGSCRRSALSFGFLAHFVSGTVCVEICSGNVATQVEPRAICGR